MKYETCVSYLELTLWQHRYLYFDSSFLTQIRKYVIDQLLPIWRGMKRKMPPLIRFLTHPIGVYHSIKPNELVTSICPTQLMLESY